MQIESARYIQAFPFVLSIIVEVISPKVTARFRKFLNSQMNNLDDDQIGTTAKKEIRDFSEYAYEIFQMYTALAITFASGIFQITIQQNTNLFITIFLTILVLFLIIFGITREPMENPFFYQSFIEKYSVSPSTILVVLINLIFISVIALS